MCNKATFGRIEEFSGDKDASWDEYSRSGWNVFFFFLKLTTLTLLGGKKTKQKTSGVECAQHGNILHATAPFQSKTLWDIAAFSFS